MSCKSEDSISLYFPNSGIEVAPYESDIRDDRRKYSAGEFRMSREAGDLVVSRVPDSSPVIVRIGGEPSRRMLYRGDSIEFKRDLDGVDVTDLMLYDPSRVLERGSITKQFTSVTPDEIVEYIVDQTKDEHGVLNGYEFVGNVSPDETREARATLDDVAFEFRTSDIPYAPAVGRFLESYGEFTENLVGRDPYTGFNFVSVTPLEALEQVSEEFAIDFWVARDGTLRIGLDGTTGQVVGVAGEDEQIKIKRYAVTTDPDQINSVYLEGAYLHIAPNLDRTSSRNRETGLMMMAEATDPTSSGTQLTGEVQKGLSTLDALEQTATRQLIREMTNRANGSIEINALASKDKEALRNLHVGDVISVADSVSDRCGKNLLTGPFMVTSIDHKSNPRQGWSISLGVSRIPNIDAIETKSVIYNPETDKQYDSLEHFKEETSGDSDTIPSGAP